MERTMQEKKNWKWITVKKRRFTKNCSGSYRKKLPKEEELYDLAELYKVFGDSTVSGFCLFCLRRSLRLRPCGSPADDAVGDFSSAAHFKTEQTGEKQKRRQIHLLFPGGRTCPHDHQSGTGTYRGGLNRSCCQKRKHLNRSKKG